MYRQHVQAHDTLLIDRAAAAELPSDESIRDWARDKRVFISSVMDELPDEREAAAEAVRAVGAQPVMFEEFGGRDANPVDAYLDEVETSHVYLGVFGRRYGTLLPTRFSATHTEFRHAERRGLRMAVWTLRTQDREGPQQAFLDEARTSYVVPAFGTPVDLRRQVGDRLCAIAAEDLAPWSRLGPIVFRASEVTQEGAGITVTARLQSDDVAHALESLASGEFGGRHECRFTWAGRSRYVRVGKVRSTTTTAHSTLIQLQLEVIDQERDILMDVSFEGLEPADLTEAALRTALLGEPNRLSSRSMAFLAELPDPLQPLRDARVAEEIVRPLAELMIVDELVGSGRAVRITKFRLGTSVGGVRRVEFEWEPSQRFGHDRRGPRRKLEGRVEL